MRIPKPITRLIESFERLPGIGPKTAQRLTFYMLHFPKEELERFAQALTDLKTEVKLCSICRNVAESDVCSVCDDPQRNKFLVAVVTGPLDLLAIEKTGFKGVYHVLHGLIDPLNNIGPEEIFIDDLKSRMVDLVNDTDRILTNSNIEVILATNTSMEGEATAMYIAKVLREAGLSEDDVKITRIARGLPVGGDIEYADDITLSRAFEGRLQF
jgi:recombination protein RecR